MGMPTENTELLRRPNVPSLTSARFFAAMLVLIYHHPFGGELFPGALGDFAHEAVTFFFVLSGFVLTYAHVFLVKRKFLLNVSIRSFVAARAVRIIPAYLFGLLIAAPFFAYGFFVSGVIDDSIFFLSLMLVPTFLQAWAPPIALAWNAPAWSLSVEWFFYLVYPAVISVLVSRRVASWGLLIGMYVIALCVGLWRQELLRVVEADAVENRFLSYFPVFHLPQFLLGVALGLVFIERRSMSVRLFDLLIVLGAVGILGCIFFKPQYHWVASIGVLVLPFMLFIFGAAGSSGLISRTLSAKPIVVLGESSYSIYILHVPILMWWRRYSPSLPSAPESAVLDFFFYAALTILVSVATFYFVESPIRRGVRARMTNQWQKGSGR